MATSTMTAAERLDDLKKLHYAVSSEHQALLKLTSNRQYRLRRGVNCIKRIRNLSRALANAIRELIELRNASGSGAIEQLEKYEARLRELRAEIVHEENRARIDRLQKMRDEMEAMEAALPPELRPAEPDLSADPDDEMIIS